MNSLEILKKELITQRKLLEQKGFPVTVNNSNPTPTEITDAINNIEMDFTITTATEADVMKGKTFFSQNNKLKIGTFSSTELDELDARIKCFISGQGSTEIILPEGITTIRQYAFNITNGVDDANVFYSTNLQFPSSLKTIQRYAFLRANITGLLVVPESITTIEGQAFNAIKISELEIHCSGLNTYAFCNCVNLLKATFYDPITSIPSYFFDGSNKLKEIVLPPKLKSLSSGAIYNCSSLHILRFTGETPPTLSTATLQNHTNAILLVPYEYYDTYFNATNYQYRGNVIYGYGEFEQGINLPSIYQEYDVIWYSNIDDMEAGTNPITSAPLTGTMYGAFTPYICIEPEDTTE